MPARSPKTGGTKVLLISIGVLVLLLGALPTAMLLAIGLAPTMVALIVDLTPGRYLTRCVGGLNAAGLVPFVHKLWAGGHTMALSFSIITDMYAWLVIYSASAIGWLLFLGLPGAVALSRQLNAKRRIYFLRERQHALLEEWGESIMPAADGRRGAVPAEAVETAEVPSSIADIAARELARRAASRP
jgi:hypothetical protein